MKVFDVRFLLASVVVASGCATHSIQYKGAVVGGGKVHEERVGYYLWGLVGGATIDTAALCPQGVAAIDNRHSFGDQLFATLTAGLYSPMSVKVECAGGRTFFLQKDAFGNETAVYVREPQLGGGMTPARVSAE